VKRLTRAMGLLAVPFLLVAGCSAGGDSLVSTSDASSSTSPTATPTPSPTPVPPPPPTPEPPPPPVVPPTDPLTGGPVVDGPVIAVKIDNTASGLPHYGVADADIVYVEQVEGGLTRLMAVYHTVLPDEVGAVRSVRTTDAELLQMFGAPALVFSGGAGIPIDALGATSTVAVSEEAGASGFWRSGAASAPYNLHANVREIAGSTPGLSSARNIGLVFAATDPRVDASGTATSLAVQFQAARNEFEFVDGHYEVIRNGEVQTDASGARLIADNVLFQNIDFEPDGERDSVGSPSYISHTVGSGTFTLYRDGHAITGNWNRPAPDQPTQYLDGAGQPVPFKPGKTWVALVPPVASTEAS
jgi:Protein of unknown function (DUF3048) N-terminal domain/Protein of unknown function (DUF3048) C-terminal domain